MFVSTAIDVRLHKEGPKISLTLHTLPPGRYYVEYAQSWTRDENGTLRHA